MLRMLLRVLTTSTYSVGEEMQVQEDGTGAPERGAVTQGLYSEGSCLSLKFAASNLAFLLIYEPGSVHFLFLL